MIGSEKGLVSAAAQQRAGADRLIARRISSLHGQASGSYQEGVAANPAAAQHWPLGRLVRHRLIRRY
jgi:hypothetical protein